MNMINIPGIAVLALIYESANSLVYRGRREEDDQPLILKLLKEDYPSPAALTRYKQEYEITCSLNLTGVVRAYDLYKYQNSLVMVLEDFGGESLRILMNSQRFTLLGILTLAIKIAESLGEIHAANIIHKDINPSNIVFNPATGQLKLIDFSISTVLSRENPTLKNPAVLEGTFAYMSPEQTGRMNRALDYRTDFYSLGVTFYELLTQKVPFPSTDPMELVHSHIAKQPIPPHEVNLEIPKTLSDIVMKLLAKTAEERYQSAYGLKADLEKCLTQLQTIGYIEDFPIGSQDISDKFQIPQKLYGREKEVENLMSAFERVSRGLTEMMLVKGYSGIGKSALVQEIYKPITRNRGYFIAGKFDQFQRTIPYSAVVIAFSELVRLLLTESEAQLTKWKKKILHAVGPNGQIIIDVIPEVELIIGPQPPVQELKPAESQNRFNLVFQNFIKVFCSREHPLVIFLDDLQWADSATLKLIELMMTDDQIHYLFLIGAYRDNEVNLTHPLMIMLDGLEKERVVINEIALAPLDLEQVNKLISETLHSEAIAVKPLAELVINKTDGNPFFVNEFLKTLYQENLITFVPPSSGQQAGWHWDIAHIHRMDITNNVVELMIGKLKKLPEGTQQVLRLVACLGNQFDLNNLCLIYEKQASETFQDLWPAIQEGLILPVSELEAVEIELISLPLLILNYKFLHDRVQQAAYALIDDADKKKVHLKIGRLLLASTPVEYRSERIFELVDHLNVGISLLTDEEEKLELARLNLEAGKKAKKATAYVAAQQYLAVGMEVVTEETWSEDYDLAFDLYKEQADTEYLNGNFEKSQELINITLSRAKTKLEKAELYKQLVVQHTMKAEYESAINAGKQALNILGIDLPDTDFQTVFASEVAQAKALLGDQEIASLIDKPEITSTEKRFALILLNNLASPIYMYKPELWSVDLTKALNVTLEYGLCPEAALTYANYGMILSAFFKDYKNAYEFGLLGYKLSQRSDNLEIKNKVYTIFGNTLMYWFKHMKEIHSINNDAFQAALDSGDLQFAGYILNNKLINAFNQGKSIPHMLEEVATYLQFSKKTKNQLVFDNVLALQLILLNLSKLTSGKFEFQGEMSEADFLRNCQENKNLYSVGNYQIRKLQVLYIYGNFQEALNCIDQLNQLIAFVAATIVVTDYNFFSSLVFLAVYLAASETDQEIYWQKIEANQTELKLWAENGLSNFLHKYLLVQAEIARVFGRDIEAIDLYNRAIVSARENEFIQYEALANELAAKFWLSKDQAKYAKSHIHDAYYCYQKWGAIRKLEDLEELYPHLLSQKPSQIRLKNALATTTYTSANTGAGELDLAAVMKASQAISEYLALDKLLAALMKICIENAGAQKGFLILPRDGKLLISAEASIDSSLSIDLANSIAVESSPYLPITVINYVERTRTDVVLSEAVHEGKFTNDPYIIEHELKSILCTPIINQGKLIGIIYLENNLTAGVFTPERLEVLKLLSSQAAISLENALLYASVEQKVQERTQELNEKNVHLSQTIHELRRTQAQLIQTEKMSSLGQMVAGVAHEINNPVSFIYGNLSPAGEYVQDLLNLIKLYQDHYPEPPDEIVDELENIDLEFLVEDLQKLMDSMKVGAERIRNIVLSLRNFSRLDEASKKPVDIHEGIDSTVMLLQPKMREQGERSQIEVIKDFAQLPKVNCYASQVNQVFMNIITNGIDALEELRNKALHPDHQPTITIRTAIAENECVQIRISDNGSGMDEEVMKKVFDPFFTTKPPGSGTGLGLSVSYQIIVEKHGGQLTCNSIPGTGTEFAIVIPIGHPEDE